MAEPDDVNEVFDLDALYAEQRKAPFQFRWSGETWELPAFSDIDWRALQLAVEIESLANVDNVADVDVTIIQRMFGYAFSPEQAERWERVPQSTTAMIALFGQWQRHGGADMGESSASTDSSASTGRPSRRTSTGTTASGSRPRSSARRKAA